MTREPRLRVISGVSFSPFLDPNAHKGTDFHGYWIGKVVIQFPQLSDFLIKRSFLGSQFSIFGTKDFSGKCVKKIGLVFMGIDRRN